MTYPIIFIHYGDSSYLEYTLRQARKTNQNTEVFLIGDDSNNKYDFVQHIKMKNDKLLDNFIKIYRHMNSNPYQFELICLARWLILRSFMTQYGLDKCYYQDSDVMLYKDVNQEKRKGFEFGFCDFNGDTAFVNSLNALEDFCMFIMDYYINEVQFREIEAWYQNYSQSGELGGVGDMTFIYLYRRKYPEKIWDLAQIHDDTTYDFNINSPSDYGPQGYEKWQGRKKIYMTEQGVFCKNIVLNKFIKFNSLHFQGDAKYYIKYFAGKLPEDCSETVVFDYASNQWINDETCLQLR